MPFFGLKPRLKPKGFLESLFHAGDLDFKSPEKERILTLLETKPTH